jgi:predicted Co/Zn/Cd cation transporter (cation efflux family)
MRIFLSTSLQTILALAAVWQAVGLLLMLGGNSDAGALLAAVIKAVVMSICVAIIWALQRWKRAPANSRS